jgi:hypothetical protein
MANEMGIFNGMVNDGIRNAAAAAAAAAAATADDDDDDDDVAPLMLLLLLLELLRPDVGKATPVGPR